MKIRKSTKMSARKKIDENHQTNKQNGAINKQDYDDFTNSSILEFLNQEQQCLVDAVDSEIDIDSIFEEINRLSGDVEDRNVEDILKEAEQLLNCHSEPHVRYNLKENVAEVEKPAEAKIGDKLLKNDGKSKVSVFFLYFAN